MRSTYDKASLYYPSSSLPSEKEKKVITRVENLKACLKVFYSNFKIRIFLGKEILNVYIDGIS